MLLVFAWARFRPACTYSLRSPANSRCWKSNTGYGLPCNACTATAGTWEMNALIMPPHLGHSGLVSYHNLATRWARHNIDTSACFGSCNNIGDVLEKLRNIRTETTSFTSGRDLVLCSSSGSLWTSRTHCATCCLLSALFPCTAFYRALLYLKWAMESPTSCVSTTSSSGESFAHNKWNPLMELLISRAD